MSGPPMPGEPLVIPEILPPSHIDATTNSSSPTVAAEDDVTESHDETDVTEEEEHASSQNGTVNHPNGVVNPELTNGIERTHDVDADANSVQSTTPEDSGDDSESEEEEEESEIDNSDTAEGSGEEEESIEEEGDADEEEDEEEDADEDEDEPALKYERLNGAAQELFERDTASALAVSVRLMALGTHNGFVHVLDFHGNRVKSYRAHSASINDVCIDTEGEFVATASVDGRVVIHALTTPESYGFDLKRQMRTISLEPSFSKRGTRAFVCGGMAGTLVMHSKGWLGHKETTIHAGEGPIWASAWRGTLIAWANDVGVKIYDTDSSQRIAYIDRPDGDASPRPDLFKCTIQWRDDETLMIAWADYVKLIRIRPRRGGAIASTSPGIPAPTIPFNVEITAVFQVDCMISGIAPHATPPGSFLVLAYIAPDNLKTDEATSDRAEQRRKAAHRPELRIISRSGEELSSDTLNLAGFEMFGCNDYVLQPAFVEGQGAGGIEGFYVVASPRNLVLVKPRDEADHIEWLVEHRKYAEALAEVQRLEKTGLVRGLDAGEIGRKYIRHLVDEGDFVKAAQLCPSVFGQDAKSWEGEVFTFSAHKQLQTIIPYVPTSEPQLDHLVYEVILVHFLAQDREALLRTIKEWPSGIYQIDTVIVVVLSKLEQSPRETILMECLAELYILNRQPTLALPYFLRLRRSNVFDLIRDNNLFTAVRDQALLLVEFDQELEGQRVTKGEVVVKDNEIGGITGREKTRSKSIALLVDHTHSIPIARVVQQLQSRPYYLYLYLDALFDKDPLLALDFSDRQVPLYAEFAPKRLMDFLRASNYYSLEKAYDVCKERDLVPEMVFLLGRMGNNTHALNLIIERLGDVHRAIDFAKEQNDDSLWEDLLTRSETKPAFIRGLLENVGAEIDPIRLIRRIKNGLEIPGLKEALIKILWDFNLQISLLEGCQTVLHGDCTDLAAQLQTKQTAGFFGNASTTCPICNLHLFTPSHLSTTPLHPNQPLALLFLCRHAVHATCVKGGDSLPPRRADDSVASFLHMDNGRANGRGGISGKIAYASMVRAQLEESCPVCHAGQGNRL